MLLSSKTTNTSRTSSTENLVKLWAEIYTVDVSSLSKNPKFYGELVKAASPEARALTAAKISQSILERTFYQAEKQAKSIYEYIPEIIDFNQAQQIAQFAYHVYQKLLEVYQQQSGITVTPVAKQMPMADIYKQVSLFLSAFPDIEKLAEEVERLFLKYQDKHAIAKDKRLLGFLTTLFNFSNKSVITQLTPVEKVLFCPYLKFMEEHVSIPWQRVCAASLQQQNSNALTLVEQMLPMSSEISATVYCRLIEIFPYYRSKTGFLSHPDIGHSCLRDLDMFQAYLWLCVLEESIRPIERELVPLCIMVMPNIGVKWEIISKWLRLLADEIESRVLPEYKSLLLCYTQGMEEAFFKARQQLGYQGELIETPSYLEENSTSHLDMVYTNHM